MKLRNNSRKKIALLVAAACVSFSQMGHAALSSYSQDFESFNYTGSTNLGDGFVLGLINETTGGTWFAGAAAPGDFNNGFSKVIPGEGGAAQGNNQLSIFTDYNPWSPFTAGGTTLETLVYRDHGTVSADDVGQTWAFSFDAKNGGLEAPTQAEAFVKVLKQSDGSYGTMFNGVFDSDANLTSDWSGGSIELLITAAMVGELVQFGFNTTATDWAPSAIYYDNLSFTNEVPVPAAAWLFGSALMGLVGVGRRRARVAVA